jgi:hypothetical protein
LLLVAKHDVDLVGSILGLVLEDQLDAVFCDLLAAYVIRENGNTDKREKGERDHQDQEFAAKTPENHKMRSRIYATLFPCHRRTRLLFKEALLAEMVHCLKLSSAPGVLNNG